jgi:hypothetical protein
MSSCNGWTNYETWRVNLEMFDGVTAQDLGVTLDEEVGMDEQVRDLADILEQEAADIIESQTADGLARSLALDFLSRVDWVEIAEHLVEE